ncbi:MAG: protein kinase [archaeon]|nr:protein kinase [archaeon]
MKDFDIIKQLGKGSFAFVFLVRRKADHQIYALKRVIIEKLKKKEQDNSLNEVRILASINHINVIGYKEAFYDEPTKSLNIVMEFADDGDLNKKILQFRKECKIFPENKIWSYAIQMLRGLKALHDRKIIHRDIKSANVFLNKNGVCKLGDLNVSKVLKMGMLYTQTGTPYYASPEVWKDKPYDSSSDIWSIGCVIYELCTLYPPFKGKDMDGLFRNVIKGKYDPINNKIYSKDLSTLIEMLLQTESYKRPTCDQILNHPVIIRHLNCLNSDEREDNENSQALLKTIRINGINDIKNQLPKMKNYDTERMEDNHKINQNILDGYDNPGQRSVGVKGNNNTKLRKNESFGHRPKSGINGSIGHEKRETENNNINSNLNNNLKANLKINVEVKGTPQVKKNIVSHPKSAVNRGQNKPFLNPNNKNNLQQGYVKVNKNPSNKNISGQQHYNEQNKNKVIAPLSNNQRNINLNINKNIPVKARPFSVKNSVRGASTPSNKNIKQQGNNNLVTKKKIQSIQTISPQKKPSNKRPMSQKPVNRREIPSNKETPKNKNNGEYNNPNIYVGNYNSNVNDIYNPSTISPKARQNPYYKDMNINILDGVKPKIIPDPEKKSLLLPIKIKNPAPSAKKQGTCDKKKCLVKRKF